MQQNLCKGLLPGRIRPLREVTTTIGAVSIRLPYRGGLGHSFLLQSLRNGYLQSGLTLLVPFSFFITCLLPSITAVNLKQFFRKGNIGFCYSFKITTVFPCPASNKTLLYQPCPCPSMATVFILKRSLHLLLHKLIFISPPCCFMTVEYFVAWHI